METNFTLEPVSTFQSLPLSFSCSLSFPLPLLPTLVTPFLFLSPFIPLTLPYIALPYKYIHHFTKVHVYKMMSAFFPQRCQLMRRNSTQIMKCKISFHKIADIATHATDVLFIMSTHSSNNASATNLVFCIHVYTYRTPHRKG